MRARPEGRALTRSVPARLREPPAALLPSQVQESEERAMDRRTLILVTALAVTVSACGVEGGAAAVGGWIGGEPDWIAQTGESGGAPLGTAMPATTLGDTADGLVEARELGLRAGSVDDNAAWDDYLLYRLRFRESGIEVHDVDVTGRRLVTVTRPDGSPVLGARVALLDGGGVEIGSSLTRPDGSAFVFPIGDVTGMRVVATSDGERAEAALNPADREHTLMLAAADTVHPVALDVLFLIDVTGSMGDEIDRLKATVGTIAERIDALPADIDLRFAMTVYRDRGDTFVTRTFEFTPDVAAFSEALDAVVASGGGDYPESLNEALHQAVHTPEWRVDDAVSLIFLVADAPPALSYEQDYDYAFEMLEAAERGIVIHPIASSGLDDQGEYVFRQLAQATGGRFVFLTYGADGGPGDDTAHHVDDYSVLSLDDLVVRIVEEALAPIVG